MRRTVALATVVLLLVAAVSGQTPSVLQIKVVLLDADGQATPVPRHELLISENPASAAPRLIVTGLDGTANVRLRPGNYTVESDQPVAFRGNAYRWRQVVDMVAGRDAVLELTPGNAEVERASSSPTAPTAPLEEDPALVLRQWRDSVVALWTPTTRATGFVIDAKGLVLTNQRVVGTATSVEVQLTPDAKVAASVLASDSARDVAILWIDPTVIASVRPVPLPCDTQAGQTPVVNGQEIFTLSIPLRQQKRMTSGTVRSADAQDIRAEFMLARGSAGGPVFTARGDLIGITSVADEQGATDQPSRASSRVVPSANACAVLATAGKKMNGATPPTGAHLPVEPAQAFPVDALKEAAKRRAGSLSPYQVSSATFDVSFITPILTFGAQYQSEQPRQRTTSKDTRKPDAEPGLVRPPAALMDFSNWSEYVMDFPPVLLVRVTPKLVEGFWTMVARGAARTQGVAIPPIKRFKSGFSRLRAFCGETEVTPIHPFKLERRVSESEAIYEGLYVFDPGALGPHCGTVRLVLFSEKEPEKEEARVVDPAVVQQIWDDFAPYRAQTR